MTPDQAFSSYTEKEFWRSNKTNSLLISRSALLLAMGMSVNHELTTQKCREWLHDLGVKPNEFMVKKKGYDTVPARSAWRYGDFIEFRFTPEAYAFAKLSGLFDETQ